MSLLKNARDAVIEKKVRQPENFRGNVLIKTEEIENTNVVSIYDNGIGIPEGREQTIFQKK